MTCILERNMLSQLCRDCPMWMPCNSCSVIDLSCLYFSVINSIRQMCPRHPTENHFTPLPREMSLSAIYFRICGSAAWHMPKQLQKCDYGMKKGCHLLNDLPYTGGRNEVSVKEAIMVQNTLNKDHRGGTSLVFSQGSGNCTFVWKAAPKMPV